MKPLLISGLRQLRRQPGRVLQTVFAVALGVALFVSSYVSLSGIETSIRNSSKAMAGKAQWVVTGSGSAAVPEALVAKLRAVPGVIAAPIVHAPVTVPGKSRALEIWGIDTQSDAMARLFSNPSFGDASMLALLPRAVAVSQQAARDFGPTNRPVVIARAGWIRISFVATIPDSKLTRALGGDVGFMDLHQAEYLFGSPGQVDMIEVAGIPLERLRSLAVGYDVRGVDSISPAASDALLRVQSLYGISLVAMLIGCFVVFSSVQVTVLERMKEVATLRAIGASRFQLLTAILLQWLLVGLLGSVAGILIGVGLSSLVLRGVVKAVNSMMSLIGNAEAVITPRSFLLGLAVGLTTVLLAAFIPALAAVRGSPLLGLRPHTYRLRTRQVPAFWLGLAVLAVGLGMSVSGSYIRTLVAIILTFLGLALVLPQGVLTLAGWVRGPVANAFGLPGFLAADNIRKAPQRTSFNVIALGGALAILVATATVVDGLILSTHRWIDASLPFDFSLTPAGLNLSLAATTTMTSELLDKVAQVPGVSFAYGVRKAFTTVDGDDVMIIGVPTEQYLEAHRRKGTLGWAHLMAEPQNEAALESGQAVVASDNFVALTGAHTGQTLTLQSPHGPQTFRLLGSMEDYSWPRGLLILDSKTVERLWNVKGLTYIDAQITSRSQASAVEARLREITPKDLKVSITSHDEIAGVADDVLHESTSAADVQVWLAAIIGFLGIGNSLVVGVLQRQREIGLLRAIGMSAGQLRRTVGVEALLIGVAAGLFGAVGGVVGGWMPLRHFTFAVTGYLFPLVIPWREMFEVFVAAIMIAILSAVVPIRKVVKTPVLTSIADE